MEEFFYKNRLYGLVLLICINVSAMKWYEKLTDEWYAYIILGLVGIAAGKRGVEVWKDRKVGGKSLKDKIGGREAVLPEENNQ